MKTFSCVLCDLSAMCAVLAHRRSGVHLQTVEIIMVTRIKVISSCFVCADYSLAPRQKYAKNAISVLLFFALVTMVIAARHFCLLEETTYFKRFFAHALPTNIMQFLALIVLFLRSAPPVRAAESTVHSPEDSHVSTSIAGIHPIDGLFGSSLSESRDSSDSRLAESPRTMPGLRQTGTTSGLGDLDTYSRRAVFASSAAHSRVPIVRAATAARTAASSSLAAPPPPTAGSSDGQQIIDLYRASRSLRSGRRASSARRNDATDTFSIDVPRSRMNAIGLRGGARTAHASNPLSRGGAGAGRALPNYGNIPQSSPVVRRTRRHSTLLDVSARLDAAATAIDAVEVGVRSASDSLDSLLHLLDSRLVSVVPSVADTRDTGEPYGVSMVPSPAAFGGGVDPRIGQDSRERAGETGLREFDQTGVATYRYSVDAVTGQLPTEEMCSEFSQGGKHSPQQEQDMSSVSGDSSTSPSSRPTLVSERTPRDGSDSVGYGISAGHLRITRAQPASTMRTATDILTSCEAESTGMPELPDADHQTGTAPILDTGPGVSSEIHATEGPTPASYLVRIATVAGDTNTGGGTALRRENPSRPTGRVVSLTPLAQDREAPAGDDVPGQPSRGGRPADDLAGTAGPFVNPPANPGDDVEGGWGNGAGRDRDNISIETVLRESEALIDRSSRVVAGIGVSVARRASSDAAVPPARVTRSLAMNTTDLLSTENRTEQVVAAVADVELESTLFAHANRIRTARRDVSDGSPREVEITAAMNGIDQERGRLMLEIARLRGQQNESLIQLLRLQQEQFLVRQRQVSTLSDIVDSFGRTVDAAWSLPHGEDSSLGRISGDVVSTLRRVLRVLLAAVPRVDSGSSAAPATADTLSIAGSSRLPAMNDPPRGDSEIPVTFPTLTVGSTLMPGSGIRSSANAIERGDIVRPVGDLTQEVIDAALAALPRLAAAASAISGARRLQGLQRNDGGRGEVDGVHDTGNRCSAETIAALPVAAAQSVGGCVICLTEGGAEAGTLCHLPCDHVFHRVCVGKWLRVQASCPTCRREVPNLEVDSTVIAVPVVPEV